jgi:hypothetical protein
MRMSNVLGLVTVGVAVTVLGAGCNSAPPPKDVEQTGSASSAAGLPIGVISYHPPIHICLACNVPAPRSSTCVCTHDVVALEVSASSYGASCGTFDTTVNGSPVHLVSEYGAALTTGSADAVPRQTSTWVCRYNVAPAVGNAIDPDAVCGCSGQNISYVLAPSNKLTCDGFMPSQLYSRMPPKVTFRGMLTDPTTLPPNTVCKIGGPTGGTQLGGSSPCITCDQGSWGPIP